MDNVDWDNFDWKNATTTERIIFTIGMVLATPIVIGALYLCGLLVCEIGKSAIDNVPTITQNAVGSTLNWIDEAKLKAKETEHK